MFDISKLEKMELNRENIILPQQVVTKTKDKNKLHIVYVMVWTQVCGGSKIILEYANRLCDRGHRITIVTYDKKPDWFYLNNKINFIQVSELENIEDNIPDCDLIVATSWKCIYSCIKSRKAIVTFFEQGGSHLFDVTNISKEKKEIVENRLNSVPFIYTVSEYSKDILKEVYKVDSEVMYNAIDNNIFYPMDIIKDDEDNIAITIIGSEDFKFKNIDGILKAVRILKNKYNNIKLNWITQTKPKINKEEAIINPAQKEIGDILRNTDIYICNSEYESFGLPTLEAMTCGAAVITTDTGGMRDFVIDKENALIINKNDVNDIIEKVSLLIDNKNMRMKIIDNAKETAKRFLWKNSIDNIEIYYKKIVNNYDIK